MTLPAELHRRAEAMLADGGAWDVPPPRDAATVALIRSRAGGIEVLLQRRPGSMAFAAGMHVFPGGRVEPADADGTVPWRGPADYEPFPIPVGAGATARFRALTVAGVRETWEEAGVALISGAGATPADRHAEFPAWLAEQGLAVAGDALLPWVHWITPEVEAKRFDTRFLVAELPEGAEVTDYGVETDRSFWITPGGAMDRYRRGELSMLPPTVDALEQLADFDEPGAVMVAARRRRPRPLLPRPYRSRGGAVGWRIVDAYSGEVLRR